MSRIRYLFFIISDTYDVLFCLRQESILGILIFLINKIFQRGVRKRERESMRKRELERNEF